MESESFVGKKCEEVSSHVFEGIVLGQDECYDMAKVCCWSFRKGTDVRNGITLSLGNLCSGFPFNFCGHHFHTSESAYLCGEFSSDTAECQAVQHRLQQEENGWKAKKGIKGPNKHLVRNDWDEVRVQWMLCVVWAKCCGNAGFRKLLLSLPVDAVIIEDSTDQTGSTATVWGAKNKAVRLWRRRRKEELLKCRPYLTKTAIKAIVDREAMQKSIGVWEGQNNMGKVLKLCQLALLNGIEPPIDYELLNGSGIYLLGEKLCLPRLDERYPRPAPDVAGERFCRRA